MQEEKMMKESTRPPVIVVSRFHTSGIGVIRGLGEAGFTVDLIANVASEGEGTVIRSSKYVRRSAEVVSPRMATDDEMLLRTIMDCRGQGSEKPVLFPTDDYVAAAVDRNRPLLSQFFRIPGIETREAGRLVEGMNKHLQNGIARSVGLLTAEEWVIDLREEELSIPDDVIYPCWAKPIESIHGRKQEMAKCDDRETLLAHLTKMKETDRDRDFLVQEYLDIDEEIDYEGVCLDQKIVMPGVLRKIEVGQYSRGVPAVGRVRPLSDVPEEINEKLAEFLRQFHYVGMFNMGIFIVGDKIYFNELNLRSGGMSYAYCRCGANLPAILVRYLLGEEPVPEEEVLDTVDKVFLYEKVAWADVLHGNVSEQALAEWAQNADILLMINEEDPKPGILFTEENLEKLKARHVRERHIRSVMEYTGWSHGRASRRMKEARDTLGISYADYDKYDFWQYKEKEEQKKAYEQLLGRRTRIREFREALIQNVAAETGRTVEDTAAMIAEAVARLDTTYARYGELRLWEHTEEEQVRILEEAPHRQEGEY